MYTISRFVLTLLHSATITHLHHFRTGSRSDHLALQQYYEAIPDLVDSLTESYQGKYGKIKDYIEPFYFFDNNLSPLDYMIELNDFVFSARKELPQDTELQNDIDSIASLIDGIVYQLRDLK